MKQRSLRRLWASLVPLACLVLAVLWFKSENTDTPAEAPADVQSVQHETSDIIAQQPAIHGASVPTKQPLPTPAEETELAESPFFEAETKARLIQVADSFEQDIQYPAYSQPILDQDALQKYLPNISTTSSVALDTKNPSSPRIHLKTSKLQYFRGETISALAFIEGNPLPESIDVSVRLVVDGEILLEADAQPVGNQLNRFTVNIDSNDLPESLASSELRLIGQFDLDGVRYEIGAPVQYLQASAELDYVGSAQVMESTLQIPVYVTTSEPGYHHLSAILFNAETGEALVHLNAEKELLVEHDMILLQAHISALKAAGHEGPYVLKNFSLIRQPSAPDFTTRHGKVPAEPVHVNGFAFGEYRDAPYIDREAQERLDFLRKLGGDV